jgi:hypothetical protein
MPPFDCLLIVAIFFWVEFLLPDLLRYPFMGVCGKSVDEVD